MTDYKRIILATDDGVCELELVPEFGGVCNRLRIGAGNGKSLNILAGLTNRNEMEKNEGYRGLPLFPFANRLDGGRYEYKGQYYQFIKNEPDRNNTLHGFLQTLQPEVVEIKSSLHKASASLRYQYDGDLEGYPFPVEININYTLESNQGFTMEISVTNQHSDAIPVGVGWHPYFQLGETVDTLSLQLPSVTRCEIDDRMLPTGVQQEFEEFTKLSPIKNRNFDDCFQLTSEALSHKAVSRLWSEEFGLGLDLWQQAENNGYRYMQVYIPSDRRSIAIEPVSCGINAFNTGEGLIHLGVGETYTVQCGVCLVTER